MALRFYRESTDIAATESSRAGGSAPDGDGYFWSLIAERLEWMIPAGLLKTMGVPLDNNSWAP
jgi:hypothetical protein